MARNVDQRLAAVIEHFGPPGQMIVAIEEMAELITGLTRRLNNKDVTDEQIIEEVADAYLMTRQLRLIFGPAAIDAQVQAKLDRIEQRIEAGHYKGHFGAPSGNPG